MAVAEAFEVFNSSNESDLPVIDNGVFRGILFKNQVSDNKQNNLTVADLRDQFRQVSVNEDTRMVSALKKMVSEGVALLPVLNQEGEIKGVMRAKHLWNEFASRSSMLGEGSWIILTMPKKDFSLSRISHLIESHDLFLIMHFVQFYQGGNVIDVHLKVNRENVNELLQSLQRFGYHVSGVIQPKKYVDDWENKFEELMRFFST